MPKDPFTFSQFARARKLAELQKKGRGEAAPGETPPPAPGERPRVIRPAVTPKPPSGAQRKPR
ncbi:MAG: hypothetical protein L0216_01735 [Planctomycetales bacterium]|nr:hypothetical protein [Planctomycetales bacterium]